jgi:hypothetical protein
MLIQGKIAADIIEENSNEYTSGLLVLLTVPILVRNPYSWFFRAPFVHFVARFLS